MKSSQEQWASKIGFVLAAAGSAIGLGAIWKFPYIAGISGGGAFFLIFLFFTITLGYPLLLAEFIIGRKAQTDAVTAFKKLAPGTKWYWIGKMGVATSFILLSFYSVIGGWILLYLLKALKGDFKNVPVDQFGQVFGSLIANPVQTLLAQLAFLILTILVISKGVQKGIEKASNVMMPALFLLFLLLVGRSLTLEGAAEGISFILKPDFTKVTSETILFAMGQAFFSLSLGVSIMVTYSSYLKKTESLPKSASQIVMMNIVIVLLAGLAIFPGVFTFGFEPDAGPTLIFAVLPAVFSKMVGGTFFFIVFLVLFLFAALTSAFSLLEIVVSVLAKGEQGARKKVSWIAGITIFIIGIPSCLSFGLLGDFTLLDKTIFDLADFMVSNVFLPLGALFIALFVPRKIPKQALLTELREGSKVNVFAFNIWYFLVKYILPIAIIIVFLDVLGVFNL